jgi:hypothetical protein
MICVTLGATPAGPSGTGVLATVTFLPRNTGIALVDIKDVILTDPMAKVIPKREQDGSVTVELAPTPTRTPLPTSTYTPGPSPTPSITPTPGPSPTPTPTATLIPGAAAVSIDPALQGVLVGEFFTVDVRVGNVNNLGAYEFALEFDPDVVSYVTVTNGPFLGSSGRVVFCPDAITDVGKLRFGCVTSDGGTPGASGSGQLAQVVFQAVAPGTSPLDLTSVALTNPWGEEVSAATVGGSVSVSALGASSAGTGLPAGLFGAAAVLVGMVGLLLRPGSGGAVAQASGRTARGGWWMTVFLRLLWRRADGLLERAWLIGRVLALLTGALVLVIIGSLLLLAMPSKAVSSARAADFVVMFKNPQTANLWLCDETVGSCEGPGQGELVVSEEVANIPDDTGLGAFEFLIYFSRGVANVSVIEGPFLSSTHRQTECQLLETENWLRFACTSTGGEPGPSGSGVLAYMTMRPDPDLVLRPTAGNGVLVRLLDDRWEAGLADESGEPIPIDEVMSATVLIQALEGDVNYDCRVNVIDEQAVSGRYGTVFGILPYSTFFDIEPSIPDFDIDIKDLQFVYGRDEWECEGPTPTPAPATETPTPVSGTATPATGTPTPPTATPTSPAPSRRTRTPTPSPTPTVSPVPTALTPIPGETLTPTPGRETVPGERTPGEAEGLPGAGVGSGSASLNGNNPLLVMTALLAVGGWAVLARMLYLREAQLSEQSVNTGTRKQRPRRSPGLRRGRWP